MKLKEFLSACLRKKRILNTMLMTRTRINNWFIYIYMTLVHRTVHEFYVLFSLFYLTVCRNKKEVIRENGTTLYTFEDINGQHEQNLCGEKSISD